jgi:hypothetical protein
MNGEVIQIILLETQTSVTFSLSFHCVTANYNVSLPVCPTGAQSGGCRFNKKPQYRYSGCHRYDGSALNIALGLKFGFDEGKYTYRGHEKFFRKVGPEIVAAEMAGLDGNATESTVMTRDGT